MVAGYHDGANVGIFTNLNSGAYFGAWRINEGRESEENHVCFRRFVGLFIGEAQYSKRLARQFFNFFVQ